MWTVWLDFCVCVYVQEHNVYWDVFRSVGKNLILNRCEKLLVEVLVSQEIQVHKTLLLITIPG